jgi:hypothetical protein
MQFNGQVNRYWPLVLSIGALLIARWDMGLGGAFLVVAIFAGFIFVELFFIRTTILSIYANVITEHKLLLLFLRHRGVNYILSSVISLYLSFYLFMHVNVISVGEIGFFLVAGVLLALFMKPTKNAANLIAREIPAKVFSRVGIVFIVVLITVLLDGLYNSFLPVDNRITQAFDVNIPLYVIDDVKHSYIYLQHCLRTVLFFKYNIQSIGLHEDIGGWFVAVRFLLLLSPTPYIAFALLFLSFSAIKKFKLETER